MKNKTKMLFCHDNKFEKYDNSYYSNGIFINDNFERYTSVFENVTVISRVKNVNSVKSLKIIDNKNVQFLTIDSLFQLFKKEVKNKIKKEILSADYVIVRLPSFIGNYVANICKKNNKPLLIEVVGDGWGSLWYHSSLRKIFAPYQEITMKHLIKDNKYTLYVTKDFLEKKYPCNGYFVNCSNVELDKSDESVLEKRVNRINSNKEILNLTTIAAVDVKYKGQKYVIECVSRLIKAGINVKYYIIGNGDITNLKKTAEKYNVSDNIIFVGGVSHNKIFDYLDNTDLYIQPSLAAEGLPRAIIEAMSRGCLCIGTNICGIPELIEDKYLFKKKNISQLFNIIKSISKNDRIEQAEKNITKSKEYEKSVLIKRRKDFFDKFRSEYEGKEK